MVYIVEPCFSWDGVRTLNFLFPHQGFKVDHASAHKVGPVKGLRILYPSVPSTTKIWQFFSLPLDSVVWANFLPQILGEDFNHPCSLPFAGLQNMQKCKSNLIISMFLKIVSPVGNLTPPSLCHKGSYKLSLYWPVAKIPTSVAEWDSPSLRAVAGCLVSKPW